MKNKVKVDLRYIAGFFDGDGCIYASASGLRATLTNVDLHVLQIIQNQFGFGIIKSRSRENRQILHQLVFWSRDALFFIQQIYPYLIIKKSQADLAFDFQSTYRTRKGSTKQSWRLTPDILNKREDLIQRLKDEKRKAA